MPKILIVDDEWLTRLEIEGMLTDLGYDVAGQAETGAEAVAIARELNPDLILMDVKMPGEMNGIDAAREIKAELGTPIVFISGYGDPEYIEAAKEIAPFGYVMKPFDEREVHAFVEIALSRKKLELKLEEAHERLEQTNLDLRKEIAERKNTEMALQESEEKYSKLFHSNPQWIHITTFEDGRYVEVNEAVKEITGYKRDEIIGRTSKELGLWADYEEKSRLTKVALEQGGFREQEVTIINKNGEHVSVLWSAATIEIMGTVYFINSVADISDCKRAEEERELTLSQFRATLEATVDGIIVVGLDSETKVFSKRFRKIWHMPDSVLDSEDANQVLDCVLDQINEPEVFSQKVQAVFADHNSNTFDTLHLKDGRVLEVYSRPQKLEDKMIGRVWAFRDVTKTKQATMESQKAQSRLQALSDASFEAIFFSDQGICIDQNSAAERMFGYSHKEAIGRNGTEWIVPEDREKVKNNMLAGYEKHYEVTGLRKDGSTFPAEIQGHMFNFMGKPTRVTALRDNSVQQQARETLRESENRFRLFMNHFPGVAFINDPGKSMIYVNSVMSNFYGLKPEEIIGRKFEEYIPPDFLTVMNEQDEIVISENRFLEIEETVQSVSGPREWWTCKFPIHQQDKPTLVGGLGIEITDRKQAEEALRKSEELHKEAQMVAHIGHWELYPEIGTPVWSDEIFRIFGLNPQESEPSFTDHETHLHPDDWPLLNKAVTLASTEGTPFDIIFRIVRSDGEIRWMHSVGTTTKDKKGKVTKLFGTAQDITDRKQAELVLQESQSKLLRAQYIARLGDFTWDISSGAVTWSEGMHRLLKYDLNEKIDYEKVNSAIHHPDDLESVTKWLNDSIVSGKENISPKEYRLVCKDGEILEVHTEGRIEYKGGEAVKLFGTCQDISERKRAEQALKNNQIFLKRIINQSPFATWISDEKGTMIKCNAALKKLSNITDEQLIGKYNVFEDEVAIEQGLIPKIRTVFEDGKTANFSVEWDANELGYKDAKKVHIEGTMFPIHDDKGDLTNVVNHWIDITDRKQAEEALREVERRNQALLDHSPVCHKMVDLDFNLIYMSANGYKLLQLEKTADVYGKPYPFEFFPATFRNEMTESLKKVKETGDTITMEALTNDSEGNEIWLDSALLPVLDDDGRIDYITVVSANTTQRKLAEKEKERLEGQLNQALKMEAMGTLAGGIAHDFNNLLMAIQGRTSIMLMKKDSSHPDIRHLKGIEDNVESAADLTRQLLGFARGGKYEVSPTDLNELVKKQNRMFGRTKKQITIHGKYEENLWSVEVDRGQIEQVLLNLYVNAWQAMPGGGDLYLETENLTLDQTDVKPFSIEPGRYVKISVTDTGVGMDKATQEKIFEPFFTTKEMGRGTGLGLASAYGIIKNHGGFINVYSEKGHGTTFNIYLPASEKEIMEDKKSAGDTLKGSETVLFVDDEDMIIEVAGELFEQLGYKVLTARSGKEAIEIYEKNKEQIDIVLLDMIMPDMSGSDTFDSLEEINPDIKVLLSSGYSINGQATEIIDRGCSGFIQKPFKMKELSQKLREILDKK